MDTPGFEAGNEQRAVVCGPRARTLAEGDGSVALVPLGELVPLAVGCAVTLPSGVHACEVDAAALEALAARTGAAVVSFRELGGAQQRLFAAAWGYVHFRNTLRFDPHTGKKVRFTAGGRSAVTPAGREVFPRINPCVIGAIFHPEREAIVVGKNALRPQYFSLVAGYMETGESMEEAFIREAAEETGLPVGQVRYVRSQPWPPSQSLMLGVVATALRSEPVRQTDGELLETRWVTREDVAAGRLELPARGSIAHQLLTQFAAGTLTRAGVVAAAEEEE